MHDRRTCASPARLMQRQLRPCSVRATRSRRHLPLPTQKSYADTRAFPRAFCGFRLRAPQHTGQASHAILIFESAIVVHSPRFIALTAHSGWLGMQSGALPKRKRTNVPTMMHHIVRHFQNVLITELILTCICICLSSGFGGGGGGRG